MALLNMHNWTKQNLLNLILYTVYLVLLIFDNSPLRDAESMVRLDFRRSVLRICAAVRNFWKIWCLFNWCCFHTNSPLKEDV